MSGTVSNGNHADLSGRKIYWGRIDSMMTQTYRHFELLVIDDASKDHTRKIVMEYAKKIIG